MAVLKKQLKEAQKLKDQAEKSREEVEKAKVEAEQATNDTEQKVKTLGWLRQRKISGQRYQWCAAFTAPKLGMIP